MAFMQCRNAKLLTKCQIEKLYIYLIQHAIIHARRHKLRIK